MQALIGGVAFAIVLGAGLLFGVGFLLSPQDKPEKVDAIVVVSGGETDARTAEGVELYQAGYAQKIVFSGAAQDPDSPSNAAAMRDQAIAAGVPAKAIVIEEKAKNTSENALNVSALLDEMGAKSIILVTSPYHQRRTSIMFHRVLGKSVTILNHSAPDQQWRRNHWWATAYSRNLTFSELQKVLYLLTSGQAA